MPTRRALLALPALLLARPAAADPDAALEALLARHVTRHTDGVNRVRYAAWKAAAADLAALDGWIAAAVARRPAAMPRHEAYAFWAKPL